MTTKKEMNTLVVGTNEYEVVDATARSTIATKQDTLVSGTNIKTINNTSILGSGNIDIQGGSEYVAGDGIDISNDVISSKLNMDLLWTNSSITSAFSPQDVFLDLSDYRFVYISFFQATNGNYYCSSLLSKLGVRDLVSSVSFSGNTNPLIARAVTVTDDTVYFGAAYAYNTYGAGTLNNNFLVPFRIYGIK